MSWQKDEIISAKPSFWENDEKQAQEPGMAQVLWNSAKQVIPDIGNLALDISKATANAYARQYSADAKAYGLPMPPDAPMGSNEATQLSDAIGFTDPAYNPQTPAQKMASGVVKGALSAAALNPTSSISGMVGNIASGGVSSLAYDIGKKATDSDLGGLVAGIAAPVLTGKALSPDVSKKAQLLLKEGIHPTVGQIMGGAANRFEEKLTSNAIVGYLIKGARDRTQKELNRSTYSRVLSNVGQKYEGAEVGREGVKAVSDNLKQKYNELLPKLTFNADQDFISDITSLASSVKNMPEKEGKAFERLLDRYLSRLSSEGTMSGEDYKKLYSEIGSSAKDFFKSNSQFERDLGVYLKETQNAFRNALKRSNPQYAPDLDALDAAYSNYAIVREAAKSPTNMENGFTPAQLSRAVSQSDTSVKKGRFATGEAPMQDLSDAAVEVLGQKTPNSHTADRQSVSELAKYLFLGGGAAAGHYAPQVAIPAAVAAGVSAIPYTEVGQKAIAKYLLSERPEAIQTFADSLRKGKMAAILSAYPKQEDGN